MTIRANAPYHSIDVVIMDLTVPEAMSGKEAMAQILKIDPKAKGIVSSGYVTNPVMSD